MAIRKWKPSESVLNALAYMREQESNGYRHGWCSDLVITGLMSIKGRDASIKRGLIAPITKQIPQTSFTHRGWALTPRGEALAKIAAPLRDIYEMTKGMTVAERKVVRDRVTCDVRQSALNRLSEDFAYG